MRRSLSKKARKVMQKMMEEARKEHPLSVLSKMGAQMMLQVALEEELCAFLGRDHYERREVGQTGNRNGYKQRTIKLGCGDVEIGMPQVRDCGSSFQSRILPPYQTRMGELEKIIPLLYANGLPTRKVKRSVAQLLGKRGLSHTTVSRISQKLVDEFKAGRERSLSGEQILYLILDAIRLGVRAGTREKEAVLVAQGFTESGTRTVLSVALGNRESHASWKGFLEDLVQRGMGTPLLVVTDGNPGLLRAVEEVFPGSQAQRCTRHKMDNVLGKVLTADQEAVRDDLRKVFYAPTEEHAREAAALFEKVWKKKYPSAVEIVRKDLDACLTYYRFPPVPWKRIRTTNAIERAFRAVKQRTRGIGRFQDEERALAMVYARINEEQLEWRGIAMTPEATSIIQRIRNRERLKKAA